MSLVITIVILLILAGVSISMLSGDNGILRQAANASFETEISTLQEGIDLKVTQQANSDNKIELLFGGITDTLGEEYSKYNDKYAIEASKIVYKEKKFSKDTIEKLEEKGIEKESKYYLIMNSSTKTNDYADNEDAITLSELQEKITKKEFIGQEGKYTKAYIVEDLNLGAVWNKESGELVL